MLINSEFYKSCCKTALSADKPNRVDQGKSCPVCYANLQYRVKANAETLRLGDRVKVMDGGAYNVATVTDITEKGIKVLRPYVQTSDFTYTGGVIGYLGFEEFVLTLGTDVVVLEESRVPEVLKNETDAGRKFRSK